MNINENSPYYSFIVSVFSEKLLNLSKEWEKKVLYTDSVAEDIMYYQTSPIGEGYDDATDVIGISTAIKLLLEEGADLFYIHDNKETLLTNLLTNRNFNNDIKDMIIDFVNIEKLSTLPIKWNNNIFHHLLVSGEEDYLEKLIQKGLDFKQNQYYDKNNYELYALKCGNLKFFEILLALNSNSMSFDHPYTYKEEYEDVPKEDAKIITLRSEINRLLNNEDILDIGTNCYDTAKFLSKYLLHSDLQNRIENKTDKTKKAKI